MSTTIYMKSGSVRVPIFRSSVNVRGKRYPSFVLRWTDMAGHSRERRIAKLSIAKAEAQRIADDLAAGRVQCALDADEIANYNAATYSLRAFTKPLALVAAEAAEAMTLAPDVPLPELARFYLEHKPKAAVDLTVADAVTAYLANRKKKGISKRWEGTLKSQLTRFAKDFPGHITSVTAEQVEAWAVGIPDVTAVTRNNYLAAVQALYNLPALAHAPHRDAIQALEACGEGKTFDQAPSMDAIWTPEEFRKLLNTALLPFACFDKGRGRNVMRSHAHLLPMLVLGGFCKMRNESEVMRARWENVHLKDRQIYANGKTGERLVTLTTNAVEWLKLCQKKSGPVWPWASSKLHKDLRALVQRCELEWRPNALRKSASTYAMKLKPDADQVSDAAGNSASVLSKYYLRLGGVTKARAREWFSLQPPKSSRVIIPLQTATA